MAYKRIKPYNLSEEELRKIWSDTYCGKPIVTFDNIEVRFIPICLTIVFLKATIDVKEINQFCHTIG